MPTLMQKIRLALRGWNRRREEKNREFLAKNLRTPPPDARLARGEREQTVGIDMDGLTVACLDGSGRSHFFDVQTGDVVESVEASDRYRRIPPQSESADREAFLSALEDSGARARLKSGDFRTELARDRKLERAWYNFRNDRAIAAMERWLREIGLHR